MQAKQRIMQTIYQTAKPFDQLLKKQKKVAGQTYRPMYYVVEQPVDEGLLLYHTMTKALLLLTPKEAEIYKTTPTALPQLIEQWFLVPQSHDDRLLSRQIRDVAKMLEKSSDAITHYTILPTTDCNARCFYCYEMGRSRIPMSQETANRTADYIINHCNGEKVTLNWFGGEPLFNKPAITLICQRLKEGNIEFSSSMITNGYLFNDDTVKEAKELWHLKWVQITLDGTEKIYNRIKAYIYKEVNAFQRVMSNIHRLQDADIAVRIRLNIDMHNADYLMELAEELHREFQETKGINVYAHALFEEVKGSKAMLDDQKRTFIYERMKELRTLLDSYQMVKPVKLDRKVTTNVCQADNDHCAIIMPSGHIGKCEHYSEDHFVGHIDNEERDLKMIAQFKERRKEIEACTTCPSYPICNMLKLCATNTKCYSETRQEKLQKIRYGMLHAYQQQLTPQQDEV